MAKQKIPSTKIYLPFSEIRDDAVIMRDGTLRAVVLVSSINFALKGEEEQEAIIQGYVQFLNSLNFTLQIVIQSRRLNISKYLHDIEKIERAQTNELLKLQTTEYRKFIKELIELSDIMAKRFYVVVPYEPYKATKRKNYFERLQEVLSPFRVIHLKSKIYQRYKKELMRRVSFVQNGLSSLGLNIQQLHTPELIELLYNTYNPEMSENQKAADLSDIQIEE